MSAQPGPSKKAVHVKWAGKTIALGTFPAAEADEKCQRAKALTRAWRSSMRPKPSREWVMVELERLGVRVVSGRLGRKAGDEGDPTPVPGGDRKAAPTATGGIVGGAAPGLGWGTDADLNNLMRRNSLSLMNDAAGRRGSLGSLGQVIGLEADRPMRRNSSLGLGNLSGGGLGMSVNPNQHYEMLKLHHMNLLNEIQETTLMMNLYQQQQLQQQQQQLQHPGLDSTTDAALLLQQQSSQIVTDPLFGATQLQQRSSLGLGTSQLGASLNQSQGLDNETSQDEEAKNGNKKRKADPPASEDTKKPKTDDV